MLTKIRSALDRVEKRGEIDKHLTPLTFRHTYAATRIQTVDGEKPVALFTVAREMGHRGLDRIEDTYGHLQRRRSRLPEVRYRQADVVDLDAHRTPDELSTPPERQKIGKIIGKIRQAPGE